MTRNQWKIAGLLFFSGFSALIYQTVWLRQFRLIFGVSTFATGAVLAIFMAGLGIGSAVLGKRADSREHPLLYYSRLELYIAAAAAVSPLLVMLVAKIYFATGGSQALGLPLATVLRLLLSLLVLGPATVLMGGTLPAAARAAETLDDQGRRGVALLYGVNTLGAVSGALLATFFLLETVGNLTTLLLAAVVNSLVAIAARRISLSIDEGVPLDDAVQPPASEKPLADPRAVYAASAIAGFAFLLMELVWYRMLSPILGGTAYMFGLVLAIALLGIGTGGVSYAFFRSGSATRAGFAITCSLEALAIAFPFALGDQLAIFAGVLRSLGVQNGFGGHVLAWTIVTMIVVFPAAFIAGIQFPLLIGLLGQGRESVGRHIGAAYAWNTAGAIAGSLAGGFGLLPLLSAPGAWRLVTLLLSLLAAAALLVSVRDRRPVLSATTVLAAGLALLCLFAQGPTGAWRHSGIGVGHMPHFPSQNARLRWLADYRRMVRWDKDGRESSIALVTQNDTSFVVNGKSDGSARGDAATQVMLGLIATMLHPEPKTALVVGLGTGSTSGWLARVPSMQRVDSVELEPIVLDVARACAPVNAGAMTNPKVAIQIADAREVLLTSRRRYDVIASEPSNPYRAGVASLFTREFYQAAADRMQRGGILAQWVQSYSIHPDTMRTIYATLSEVFPHVQTWMTESGGDLILVASREPIVLDADALRQRLTTQPYSSAVFNVWRVTNVEGVLGRLVANEDFARAAAREATAINTDDRPVIEFGFARSVGDASAAIDRIVVDANAAKANRPLVVRGVVDWGQVDRQRISSPSRPDLAPAQLMARASKGDATVEAVLRAKPRREPVEDAVILAALRAHQKRPDEATELLRRAFHAYRIDPWPDRNVMASAISEALAVASTSPQRARLLQESLSQPFVVALQETQRQQALIAISQLLEPCGAMTMQTLRAVEPHPFWTHQLLALRARCYAQNRIDLAGKALQDLQRYEASEPGAIVEKSP